MDDHTDTELEWALGHLDRLRSMWLDVNATLDATNGFRQQYPLIQERAAILSQFRSFLKFYLPKQPITIKGPRVNAPNWTSYTYNWGRDSFIRNHDDVRNCLIQHPEEFLSVIEGGIEGEKVEVQEQKYQELKEEVEDMIDRFKVVLVSNEFL